MGPPRYVGSGAATLESDVRTTTIAGQRGHRAPAVQPNLHSARNRHRGEVAGIAVGPPRCFSVLVDQRVVGSVKLPAPPPVAVDGETYRTTGPQLVVNNAFFNLVGDADPINRAPRILTM